MKPSGEGRHGIYVGKGCHHKVEGRQIKEAGRPEVKQNLLQGVDSNEGLEGGKDKKVLPHD